MAGEPDNIILAILREIREQIAANHAETKADAAKLRNDLQSEINSLGRVVAADLHDLDAKLSGQITTLREAVMHSHSSVLGHGTIISELETRLRRVERQLNIDPEH